MIKYPKYKDSEIAWLREIPEHWGIESFKNILTERNEKNNPVKSKEILSLSINKGVTLYAEKTTNLDRFKDDLTKYKLAHKGDLVLNSMNMIVGAVGVSDYLGCVSPVYYTFYGECSDAYTARFYEYLFRCKTVQRVLYSLGRGLIAIDRGEGKYNTLRLKVSREDLRSMRLPFPKLIEQTAIVNFLDYKLEKIDRFIAKKKQLIDLLTEQKAATTNQAITKGIIPKVKLKYTGIEWLGNVPCDWSSEKLKYLISIQKGKNPKEFASDVVTLPYLSMEYLRGKADSPTYPVIQDNLIEVSEGEVLVLWDGANAGEIMRAKEGYLSSTMAVLRPKYDTLDNDFLFYFLKGFEKIYKVLSSGTTIPHFDPFLLNNIIYAIPDIKEQSLIVDYIDKERTKINKTISTIEKELDLVEEYKTALITEAVTGKIDVRNYELGMS